MRITRPHFTNLKMVIATLPLLIMLASTGTAGTTVVHLDCWNDQTTCDLPPTPVAQYSSLPIPSVTTCTFHDPLPAGTRVTGVLPALNQNTLDTCYLQQLTKLNGVTIGEMPTWSFLNMACTDATVVPAKFLGELARAFVQWRPGSPYTNPDGIPGYVYGGTNVIEIQTSHDPIGCTPGPGLYTDLYLQDADIELTTTDGHVENVSFDLDGTFPTTGDDDLPRFVPGSDPTGKSVALPQLVTVYATAASGIRGKVTFELLNVSTYPGEAMNWPLSGATTAPDMDFGSGVMSKTVTLSGSVASLPLYIRDYAARGTLRVTIPNGTKSPTVRTVGIPLDLNGDKIPDCGWIAEKAPIPDVGFDPAADIDNAPTMTDIIPPSAVGTGIGDGLTNFEEYRGFVLAGVHTRTNPFKKDIFLQAEAFGGDIQFAYPALPTATQLIKSMEYDSSSRVLNLNHLGLPGDTATGEMLGHIPAYVVPIVAYSGDTGGVRGKADCLPVKEVRTPQTCKEAMIFVTTISNAVRDARGTSATEIFVRRTIVAHEVGHTVNLYHVDKEGCIMYSPVPVAWPIPSSFCPAQDIIAVACQSCPRDCLGCGKLMDPDVEWLNRVSYSETESLRVRK